MRWNGGRRKTKTKRFSLDFRSWRSKAEKTRPWVQLFCAQHVCEHWRHEQCRNVRQEYQMRHEPTPPNRGEWIFCIRGTQRGQTTKLKDRRAQQPLQVACVSGDLRCWGVWNTAQAFKRKRSTIFLERTTRKGHCQSLEHWNCFKGNAELRNYGLFRAHR